ncbi:hypothetical protein [Parasedimentitalea marina]|uniref:hypothetical protein n=1 Tax=Parasedimentitalea marina TaxID=2483033 RepID=UPI000FD78785|nr:hypothetical protein [Parasedimentitalea marina]
MLVIIIVNFSGDLMSNQISIRYVVKNLTLYFLGVITSLPAMVLFRPEIDKLGDGGRQAGCTAFHFVVISSVLGWALDDQNSVQSDVGSDVARGRDKKMLGLQPVCFRV